MDKVTKNNSNVTIIPFTPSNATIEVTNIVTVLKFLSKRPSIPKETSKTLQRVLTGLRLLRYRQHIFRNYSISKK